MRRVHWLACVALLGACQPGGSVAIGPRPSYPGASGTTAPLGPYQRVNRARVEEDLARELRQYDAAREPLQLRAEYAAASEAAATALADWAQRMAPSTEAAGSTRGAPTIHVAVTPPPQASPSVAMEWGPVWSVTLVRPEKLLTRNDLARWAAMLSQLALDERWRLVTYGVVRSVRRP